MALAPLMVLAVMYLPPLLPKRFARLGLVALIAIFLGIYALPRGRSAFQADLSIAKTYDGIKAIRQVWTGRETSTRHGISVAATPLRRNDQQADVFVERLGFQPDFQDKCCHINDWTYADLANSLQEIRGATMGRSVYVDTVQGFSTLGVVAGGVYFLADLRAGTAFTEPLISIWVDDNVSAAMKDLVKNKPECVVSGSDSRVLLTKFLLDMYGNYSEHAIRTTVNAMVLPGKMHPIVYCKERPSSPNGQSQ